MKEKFKNIPVEYDTKVISSMERKIGKFDAIHEIWIWEGTHGESCIFYNLDIINVEIGDIINLMRSHNLLSSEGETTVKQTELYTFVNFNFEV